MSSPRRQQAACPRHTLNKRGQKPRGSISKNKNIFETTRLSSRGCWTMTNKRWLHKFLVACGRLLITSEVSHRKYHLVLQHQLALLQLQLGVQAPLQKPTRTHHTRDHRGSGSLLFTIYPTKHIDGGNDDGPEQYSYKPPLIIFCKPNFTCHTSNLFRGLFH